MDRLRAAAAASASCEIRHPGSGLIEKDGPEGFEDGDTSFAQLRRRTLDIQLIDMGKFINVNVGHWPMVKQPDIHLNVLQKNDISVPLIMYDVGIQLPYGIWWPFYDLRKEPPVA